MYKLEANHHNLLQHQYVIYEVKQYKSSWNMEPNYFFLGWMWPMVKLLIESRVELILFLVFLQAYDEAVALKQDIQTRHGAERWPFRIRSLKKKMKSAKQKQT